MSYFYFIEDKGQLDSCTCPYILNSEGVMILDEINDLFSIVSDTI